jgi:hypothetical protein
MRTRHVLSVAAAAGLAVALWSCGSEDGGPGPGDTTPPDVSQVNIPEGATDVGLIQRIEVTFSEAMAELTINEATFGVNERSVDGYVEYDPATRTASFLPDTLYAPESPYELSVSGDVTDEAGNPLTPFTRSFGTGPLDCEHLRDQFEPNGEISEATPVELDTRYRVLTICQDDQDKYMFTVEETMMVRLYEWIRHNDAEEDNFAKEFLRAEGEPYASSGRAAATGDSFDSFHFTFHPGTYYLDVYSNDDPVYTLYEFTLGTEPPCRDDEYEDNDFIDEAVPITPGTITGLKGCWLDRDFFAVDLEAGQTLTVTVTAEPGAGTRRLNFYDPQGDHAGGWTGQDNPLTGWDIASETGVHFFKVRFWKDDVDYEIEVEVTD